MSDAWRGALEAVHKDTDFAALNALLAAQTTDGIRDSVDWNGEFLTPLFVAVLLRLDDHIPALLSLGADPAAQCLFGGWLCCPLHAAAMRGDCTTMRVLLDAGCDVGVVAEGSALEPSEPAAGVPAVSKGDLVGCNALHLLVAEDSFCEEVYRLLMRRGAKLSVQVKTRSGQEIWGLKLPHLLGNKVVTEEKLDSVIGEEVRSMLHEAERSAAVLNAFLEAGSALKLERKASAIGYRFVSDIDFALTAARTPLPGEDEEPNTALLYAAHCGSREGTRLLLYAGADTGRSVRRGLLFDSTTRTLSAPLTALHLAVVRGDAEMTEQLLFFDGAQVSAVCDGEVRAPGPAGAPVVQELWAGLTLAHMAVVGRHASVVPSLKKMGCDLGVSALRSEVSGEGVSEARTPKGVTPLHLAVLLEDLEGARALLAAGAPLDDGARAEGLHSATFCEMFGGEAMVGLEDWVAAILSGEAAVQRLVDQKVDLARAMRWPQTGTAAMLENHRLSSPELVSRLTKALEGYTWVGGIRPVHLACMLQQPWALKMIADAGAAVSGAPPCVEEPADAPAADGGGLRGMPMSVLQVSARVGSLKMIELLCQEPSYGLSVGEEMPLAPDLTQHFFPKEPMVEGAPAGGPFWAWRGLRPLELAILNRRVDATVLLVRLGSDLLHTVDHVALATPSHYTITEGCFNGLTPLHLCALLNEKTAAVALLNEGAEGPAVVPGEPPARQRLLSATCRQCWATVDTAGDPAKEPWLWKDLTPLHLAIISKSYDVADLLVDLSTSATLALPCTFKDLSGDSERNFSTLLLAFENDLSQLHRKIAKKFPTC